MPEHNLPRYQLIREQLRTDILNDALPHGSRLPAITDLARDFSVTAATIRRALQDLTAEGLVHSHVGRGTFVHNPLEAASDITPREYGAAAGTGQPAEAAAAPRARQIRPRGQQALTDLLTLAQRPGVIAFTRGVGDPDTIAKGTLTELTRRALASGEELFLDYGDPRGLPGLREAIAALYTARGAKVTSEQVLVTSGSQQAISLMAQLAAEHAMPVWCETPCYSGVVNAFQAFGPELSALPRGESGPDPAIIPARDNNLLYICPVIHNPTGLNVSGEGRRTLADWASHGNLLLSDEVFSDLQFEGPAVPSFLSDPGPEHAAVLGSLSKSFISGLRVGWIITSESRVRELTALKKSLDLGCPPLMQGIAQAFLTDRDGYTAHGMRMRERYRMLRDTALASLERHMPSCVRWTRPEGGFQLWVTLPEGLSSVQLYLKAVEYGAAFLPGPLQDLEGGYLNSFRLCYGTLSPAEIETGIERIGRAVRELLEPAAPGGPDGHLVYV